jgi:hypothetical protein
MQLKLTVWLRRGLEVIKLLKTVLIGSTMLGTIATAGEIGGRVINDEGTGLQKVRLCLADSEAATGDCRKVQFTNKSGYYTFKGLNQVGDYRVSVAAERSLRSRKADSYKNLVWAPGSHQVSLASRSEKLTGINFQGTFNFSNFIAQVQLSEIDFPELRLFDTRDDLVFLKLFTRDASNGQQQLIYLGQVADKSTLLLEVSVPLAVSELHYEIYSQQISEAMHGIIRLDA